jgi:hypothetical protein
VKFYVFFVCVLISNSPWTLASELLEVSHYQKHSRYDYGEKLLDLALSKLDIPYQINVITPNNEMLNEARGEIEVIKGNIDIQWMSTTIDRESQMIPIKTPIYQGILGLRLLLVNQLQHQTFSQISTLEDLQKLTGGHGLHWGDLPVYAANELPVLSHKHYNSIFKMLELGRIDYFHRGLNEIWGELATYKDTLKIADNVMLFYPLPVYFFVTKSNPELAKQLEKGIRLASEDGSFKKLFEQSVGHYIANGKLESRKLIILKNPNLPKNTPFIETNWWLPGKFETQMKTPLYD